VKKSTVLRDPSCTIVIAWLVRRFATAFRDECDAQLTGTVQLFQLASQFQFCFPLFSCQGSFWVETESVAFSTSSFVSVAI
jgi:hypothetical protein